MTSTTEAPSPPPIIERPIAGREFSFFVDILVSFLSHLLDIFGESRVIHYDPVISGNYTPLI